MNNICTNFQLPNPDRFREIGLDRQFAFPATNFYVFAPLGGQKSDFRRTFLPIFSFLTPTGSEKSLRMDRLSDIKWRLYSCTPATKIPLEKVMAVLVKNG